LYLCKKFSLGKKIGSTLKKISIYLFCALALASCSTTATLNKANRIYAEGGYDKAAGRYKSITGKVKPPQREQVYFNLAECYRKLGKTKEAELVYTNLFRAVKTPNDPEIYLRYGQVLLANEKYDKAQELLTQYKKQAPDDPMADVALASIEMAKKQSANQAGYTIELMSALNSTANDYTPAYGSDDYETILITSTRTTDNQGKKKYDVTGEICADIYFSRLSRAGKWDKPRNMGEIINTKFEDGAAVFNSSYNSMYFTRCRKMRNEKLGCQIFIAKREGDDWGEPEALDLAPDSITVAHPALSDDELTLYFASDLGSGGKGTMDIWKVTRGDAGSDWGEPINLGQPINTKGNELFPFIRPNGVLYFASDGHVGFGGLDIFRATPDSLGYWTVENMGMPINSPADDFALIIERENERGFFASRRKIERTTRISDNIFRFERSAKVIEYFFEGIAKDEQTKATLKEVDIRLVGSNGASLRRRTEENGTFRFRVNAGLSYLSVASRNGYLNGRLRFSTEGWENGHVLRDTFYLTSTDKPIEIPNIFFEFGKAALDAMSRQALDSLVGIMKDNAGIVIDLRAHTDSRGSDDVNRTLSQQRAQAVVDYLINNGIDEARMEAVGLGAREPKVVSEAIARQHKFLRAGQQLTERFINNLASEDDREVCHALNRRTEMQVVRSNYVVE